MSEHVTIGVAMLGCCRAGAAPEFCDQVKGELGGEERKAEST